MGYMNGQPSDGRTIAYCHHPMHRGKLSATMMKNHDCLNKRCKYLHIYEEHPYWQERRTKKVRKKVGEYLGKGNHEGLADYITRLLMKERYEDSTQEMGGTDIWGQNDDL
jgi:hypothetical protein